MRNGKTTIALCISVISVLCSCSVYKDYKRPEIPVVDSLYVSADTASIADLSWRELFKEPKLQALIETALKNNADILCAREKVLQAKSALTAAHLAFLPGVGIEPNYTLTDSKERYNGTANGFSVPLKASWELDFSGKILVGRRRAQAVLAQNEVYLRSIQTELIATVAEYYYTLEMLDAKLRISQSTAKSWSENVRIMKSMKQAGMTNEASVSQTEANAFSIEASLHDLEYQIAQTENNLSVLLGVAPRRFERGELRKERIKVELLAGVPAKLLSRRPDVMRAEYELKKCFYDKALAHAAFYPSVTISGEFGWEKALTSPAGWLLSFGGGLVQPLFRRGTLVSNLRVSESREREAATNFRQSLLKAGSEVSNAIAKCKAAESKENIRNDQIEALKSAEKSTKSLMRHAQSTYLEVLTAQQSLLSARLQQVSDHYDSVQGIISLYKALGGGAE